MELGRIIKRHCRSRMIRPEDSRILLSFLIASRDIPGDVVELGCAYGSTSLVIQIVLTQLQSNKIFHVYDSFEGLPNKTRHDGHTPLYKGKLRYPQEAISNYFKRRKVKLPIIHKGWFKNGEYPEQIAFAFLDGDFYNSITDSLIAVYPRLSPGGIIVVHDYENDLLPGAKLACTDYFADKSDKVFSIGTVGVVIKGGNKKTKLHL